MATLPSLHARRPPPPAPQAPAAAAAQAPALAREQALPIDPAVTRGTLPNGLKYFIRENHLPENRVLLRLAVNAGSVYEAEDQQGLAHLLEHMAFNGTANFKPGELVSFFETAGARFGPHVNAYTSFDETVYLLQVATDREGLVDKALLALSDFAGRMTLDPEEVDKERGVVIEEWRLRLGASWRILEQQAPVLFHGSRYAERLPIGTPEVLRSFPVARLRDFYETWYRPDRMAVVVVGAIDPAAIEQTIQEAFGPLEGARPPAPVPDRTVPPHDATLIDVAADSEAQATTISVLQKRPPPPQGTVDDYRETLVRQLLYRMLNLRFAEIARREDAPFLGAGAGSQPLTHTATTVSLTARVEDGALDEGLEALIVEARRARELGFSEDEVVRAKKSFTALLDRLYAEREKTESSSYAREYVSHYLTGEPIPGLEFEYRMATELLKGITREEVSEAGRELLDEQSRVVLAASPEKDKLTLPTEAGLRDVLARAKTSTILPWEDRLSGLELMADEPVPGRVTATRRIEPLGVTVLTLSNGAEVWLKPTDFKNDQVVFSAYALGGASTAPEEEFFDTVLAASLVNVGGVGGFTPPDLARLLAGTLASATPYIDLRSHGVRGSARPQDVETALQLMHLAFTNPGTTDAAFQLMTRQLVSLVANRDQNPAAKFSERLRELTTGGHYSVAPLTVERVRALRLPVMRQAYAQRFGSAADFTFFFVGAFDLEALTPLIARYVASLPSTGPRTRHFRPLGFSFPETIDRLTVEQGREPKGQTVVTFFADAGADPQQIFLADIAASVLQIRLREILREDLGGTYTVSAEYGNALPEKGYGTISVGFGSAPESAERLTGEVLAEITRLRAEGPSPEDCAKVREQERQQLELALKQNDYWLDSLQTLHVLGLDPLSILERDERIETATPDNVGDAMRKYLPLDRYTIARLLPAPTQ